ncbi:MAG: RNHCP domain-containing protein [Candidatus Micrarchaeia archaeon]
MNTKDEQKTDKNFVRKRENFKCINCGKIVEGNGYTDHCPHCLFSLHVDINPGDRKEKCHGIMKPIKTYNERNNFIIYYECQKCGIKKQVKAAANDDKESLFSLL